MKSLAPGLMFAPAQYIWGALDKRTVEKYAQVAEESDGWPFPPVLVRPVPVTEAWLDEHATVNREEIGDTIYEIVDGVKRHAAAMATEQAAIPVVIEELDAKTAAMRQMTENLKHGKGLDLGIRDAWIRYLTKPRKDGGLGLSTRQVAAEAGISRETVRRIMHNDRSGKKSRAAAKERRTRRWSPDAAFERLGTLADEIEERSESLSKYLDKTRTLPGGIDRDSLATLAAMIERLGGMPDPKEEPEDEEAGD